MQRIEQLRQSLPDSLKDVRLNLSQVLESPVLPEKQRWSVALCSAIFLRHARLEQAIRADAEGVLDSADMEDAQAAAALMAMNTIYYRARHMIDKPAYHQRRAGLRMNRMGSPATSREQFELCALACAALEGCEACLKSHEASLIKAGVSEESVHEVLRLAAVMHSAAVALGA